MVISGLSGDRPGVGIHVLQTSKLLGHSTATPMLEYFHM